MLCTVVGYRNCWNWHQKLTQLMFKILHTFSPQTEQFINIIIYIIYYHIHFTNTGPDTKVNKLEIPYTDTLTV
jgi:hypothetical protein